MNDSFKTMKIFLDTADTQAIKDGYETGLIDGITTNPTPVSYTHLTLPTIYSV